MPEVIHSTCNMGARDSPDMYALGPAALGLQAYLLGKSLAPMLQLLLIVLITRSRLSIAQASSSFEWLDTRTSMSTTSTLITEALCRVTSLQLF